MSSVSRPFALFLTASLAGAAASCARSALPSPTESRITGGSWIADYLDGSRALEEGDLPRARAAFEASLAKMPSHAASAYQLACVCSREGDRDAALAALARARDAGFDDAALANWDADLAGLRTDARFPEFVASLFDPGDCAAPILVAPRRFASQSLIFSPDGSTLTTLADHRHVATYDLRSGAVERFLARDGERVMSAALSPDGRSFVLAVRFEDEAGIGHAGAIRIVDAASGGTHREVERPIPPIGVGSTASSGRFWTIEPGTWRMTICEGNGDALAAPPPGVEQAALSPDGSRAILVYRRGMERTDVAVFDVDRGAIITRHDDFSGTPYLPISFSPSGERVAIGDRDGRRVMELELETGSALPDVALGDLAPDSLVHLSDFELLAASSNGQAAVVTLDGSSLPRPVPLPAGVDGLLDLDGARSLLLVQKRYTEVSAIDPRTGAVAWALEGNDGEIASARFSPDDEVVAIARSDGALELRDARTGELRRRLASAVRTTAVDADVDEETVVIRDSDGKRSRLEVATGRSLTARDDDSGSTSRAATSAGTSGAAVNATSPDGLWLAKGSGSRVVLAGLADGASTAAMSHEIAIDGEVRVVAFEPDGRRLWIGNDRSQVFVHDVDGTRRGVLDLQDLDPIDFVELGTLSFRADSSLALATSTGFAVVAAFDPKTLGRRWAFSYSGGNPAAVQTSFGASGDRVYVYGQGGWTPRIVDAATGATLLDLAGRGIWSLRPTLDDRRVIAETERGLECIDATTGEVRWTRIDFAGGDWLLRSESGHVDGTPGACQHAFAVTKQGATRLDLAARELLDAKKVAAAAAGVAVTRPRPLAAPRASVPERAK